MNGVDRRRGGFLRTWVPRWWRGEVGVTGTLLNLLLWPAEQAYHATMMARGFAYGRILQPATASIPVISVGNIAVGGAGKTPVTAWLADRLVDFGRRPGVVLRGYGADEVLVHQELNPHVPVFATADRAGGARQAADAGCDTVILDDGFQHLALGRDLDLVLIAVESWSAHPRLIPRGPWREGMAGLRRADAIMITRKVASAADAARIAGDMEDRFPHAVVATALLASDRLGELHDPGAAHKLDHLSGRSVVAVASLADPLPLQQQLRDAGATVELLTFPDHHDFSAGEAAEILLHAAARPIVVTRKEAVKLRPLISRGSHRVLVLQQRVQIEKGAAELMDRVLKVFTI
ncbi:tetraacyldisaccharide 4'-kinase [soil metagenome]